MAPKSKSASSKPRTSDRLSKRKIKANIATITAADEAGSDEEFPTALLDSDEDIMLVEDRGSPDAVPDEEEADAEDEGELVDELKEQHQEESEEEDESEQDDEPPKKRKHTEITPKARNITYTVSIFTPAQMKKQKGRGAPVADIFVLKDSKEWDTVKAQILVKIANMLNPEKIDYDDYKIDLTVPRKITSALPLNEDKYGYLISTLRKLDAGRELEAKIIVEPKAGRVKSRPVEKENAVIDLDSEDEGEVRQKKKRKTVIPNEKHISPLNDAMNTKIADLRSKWACPTPRGGCSGSHCFISPNDPDSVHFPLGHVHMESWAAAVRFATLDSPPNNKLSDALNPKALGSQLLLVQRRLKLRDKQQNGAVPQINNNFTIPPELLGVLGQPALPAPTAAASTTPSLIPPQLAPGAKLSIEDFCRVYELDDEIKDLFKAQRFKSTDSFQYIVLDDLKVMGFSMGDVAELKVAVSKWASALPVQ
ncbi:hypothetical protein B0H17DRAFT_1193940 [Mycena rosella]|uniref:SAM domain-containing protein n=1 Tax=Mycena rosella TaxID=1033263 RepID=A0AAD7GS59_MYCRO|nr:hypothetical protein B0H17DRAFT_1193940 [Mycena rosella]